MSGPEHPIETGAAPALPAEVIRFAALPVERQRLLLHTEELLGSIDFGSVILTMHDGQVVQVETSEKIRLT